MSIDATRWAWQQQGLRPSTKLVLLSLADRASETHECFPSIARLSADTGLYRETIHDAIRELEEAGMVSVDRHSGRGNRYALIGIEDRHQSAKPVGKSRLAAKADQSAKAAEPVGKSRPDQSAKAATNLSSNQPITIQEERPPNLDLAAWSRWLDYRKQIKKPIRPVSVPAAQRALARFGANQANVVEQSIANGWQGLFPLKQEDTNGRRKGRAEEAWDEYAARYGIGAVGDSAMLADSDDRPERSGGRVGECLDGFDEAADHPRHSRAVGADERVSAISGAVSSIVRRIPGT